ncbi:MAG: glycosyltransferase family 4 protein [Acidobacteriota bacterium]
MEPFRKAVVAMSSNRDHYQLPLALYEGDVLETLVTDMYLPADRQWFDGLLAALLPRRWLAARFCAGLDSRKVRVPLRAFGTAALMQLVQTVRFNRYKDQVLSREARRLALQTESALFCYSYYASEAFKEGKEQLPYRIIFQLHPHPQSVRNLLSEELDRTPFARMSLQAEPDMKLTGQAFQSLAEEPHLANGWVTASTFTARTLAENGIPFEKIHVVPYGVNSEVFVKRAAPPDKKSPFTVIYVGSLIQRKGLSYLLDAARLLGTQKLRILLCGRGVVDWELLKRYADLPIEIKLDLPRDELVKQIQQSDLFVLPSLIEGFGHVIPEAMACGVAVITTSNTCGPDVIEDGQQGFIVPIRNAEAIADKLSWAIENREAAAAMGEAAARRARTLSWENFRARIRDTYKKMIGGI